MRALRERRASGSALIRDDAGRKQCSTCAEWLYTDAYVADTSALDGLAGQCKACVRDSRLTARFGVDAARYDTLLSNQGGVCAICKRPDPAGRALAVDHDHTCCPAVGVSCGKCVRGLLCWPCNVGIGHLRDDVSVLESAIHYLTRSHGHAVEQLPQEGPSAEELGVAA
ncbi:endonuclease VII domain-containing protein [Streptomyces sp. NBC_00464]|uniref:endonuclease VII domain-containing protein n=1 Tax=Streptomyces sp. NBC_00464 TaxID=2975751 RepID=UPI003FA68919